LGNRQSEPQKIESIISENTVDSDSKVDPTTLKNINYRNNWNQYITFDKPHRDEDYTSFALGGVQDLSVVFFNKMDYTVESILLNIDYLNLQSGNIRETKIFEIKDFYPTTEGKRIQLPNSSAGQTVDISIIKIKSKNFNFCYDSEYDNSNGVSGNKQDPWKCK
jgi:hypothetical protein